MVVAGLINVTVGLYLNRSQIEDEFERCLLDMKTKFSETKIYTYWLIDGLSASGIYIRHIDASTLHDGFLDGYFDCYIHWGIILSHYYM